MYSHAALAEDEVVGIVAAIGVDAVVLAAGQCFELFRALVEQGRDVLEEVGTLCGDGLHVGVLVLYHTGLHRIVHVPCHGHATALGSVQHLLCRRGCVDDVIGIAQELGHQFALGHQHRFDQVGGEETILCHHRGCQCQLGCLARDQVEVGRALAVLGEYLDEAGVVGAVVVVMCTVHIE